MRQLTDDTHRVERGECWELVNGDCIEDLDELPQGSIDYSVFSPPFASLYTYSDSPRDMGNCDSTDTFLEHYGYFCRALVKAMKPGRLVSVHCMDLPSGKERDGVIGLKDFPGMLTLAMQSAGFVYHSKVVIWKDPVTAMQRTKAIGLLYKQLQKDAALSRNGIPDEVRTFRAPGDNATPIKHSPSDLPVGDRGSRAQGLDPRSNWQNWASPVWMDINPTKTLQAARARDDKDERHICPLQLEVIERCIHLWSNEGETVYSPFAGIGSEGYQAIRQGRKFRGCELKESYFMVACNNLSRAEAEIRESSLLGRATA